MHSELNINLKKKIMIEDPSLNWLESESGSQFLLGEKALAWTG